MPRRPNSRNRLAGAAAMLGLSVLLAGCAQGYRMNPTPGTMTLGQSPAHAQNRLAITTDTNLRALWEDLARSLYLDRPTHLTDAPPTY